LGPYPRRHGHRRLRPDQHIRRCPRRPRAARRLAPWTDEGTTLTRAASAGGRIVRLGGPSFVVVVEPERADYIRRIKDAGALLIVDPRILAACFSLTPAVQK
jgi:hypothetical protein